MPIAVLMPALSPTMKEGNLVKWYKNEGETIAAGDVLADIETDKATMEVEAVDEGTLAKIVVSAGTPGVAVNAPIAVLLEEGESTEGLEAFIKTLGEAPKPANETSPSKPPQEVAAQTTPQSSEQGQTAERLKISPLARKLAAEKGIDLTALKGSGPGGRIVKKDIDSAGVASTPQSTGAPTKALEETKMIVPEAQPLQPGEAEEGFSGYEPSYALQPISTMRGVIAGRLQSSKQTAPHFYVSMDVKADEILALRGRIVEKTGQKFSVNDFVLKATALALEECPSCNASWSSKGMRFYQRVDLAVAVSIPDGLVTPVLRDAARQSLSSLSQNMKILATKARDGGLKPAAFQGGTFTVSNMGMFGVTAFSAILNPPQAGILAVGAAQKKPALKDGALVETTYMNLTLSVDHRLVDGVSAAEFLGRIKAFLEEPALMLASA